MHSLTRNKKHSDKTKCMYFIIKDEKCFDKYMKIWEKVINIIKKYLKANNKEHLKAEKKIHHKRKLLMVLYTSNID